MDIMTTGTDQQVVIPDPAPAAPSTTTAAGTGYGSTTQGPPVQRQVLVGGKAAQFENADVVRTVTQISGAVQVEMGFEDISLDDRVRVCGEFRVKEVRHRVGKDGEVERVQVLQPLADQPLQLVPYDHTNPNDNGIVRMRP